MTCHVQIACSKTAGIPTKKSIQTLYQFLKTQFDIAKDTFTIRIVDAKESQYLNKTFRHKDKPTNVLSFPETNDLALCHPVIQEEALSQNKPIAHHYTHLIIHGVLHLLGYNHEIETEAAEMENLEIELLKMLNIPNPYEDQQHGT